MSVLLSSKALAEKVADMAKEDQDQVTQVCRDKRIERWIVFDRVWIFSSRVATDVSVGRVRQRTKLCMLFLDSSNLSRRRRSIQRGWRLVGIHAVSRGRRE